MGEVFSFEELEEANGVTYDVVPNAYGDGKDLRLGSIDSGAMISWLESRKDERAKQDQNLRLIVKSVVDKDGRRLPDERDDPEGFAKWVERFRRKDSDKNSRVLLHVFKINGMDQAAKALESLKNVSGGPATAASPTA